MATEKRPGRPDPTAADRRRKPTTRAEATERVASRIDEKITHTAAKLERVSAKVHGHQEMLDRLSGHLGALDVWTRIEPAGRRPRFTRDEIAAAAVRIADAEGFAAVSMRHLASELGAGTMTLYHYVRTKDELLSLVHDAVMGEVVVPSDEELPPHWRDAMTLLARRTRQAMLNHPWTLDITDDPAIGPNSVRHFDQSLQAVSSLDISLGEKLDIVSTVDEYVFGHCVHERNNAPGDERRVVDEMAAYVNGLVATGDYPQLAALADEHGLDAAWALVDDHFADPHRFERNLACILDGIEAGLGRRTL